MRLKRLKLSGFKSFAKSTVLEFPGAISAIVGPNGSGKSNVAESIAWVLGEQSIKSLRGKKGEDLIFNGSSSLPRMGKASVVLIFSDSKGEISVSRSVFRDGLNKYSINEKTCRLKDVADFLSVSVGAGSLKHHIVSQGEADRILSASLKERRELLEDALGLRTYQLKKEEGERKLFKTGENINQANSLRKEIQPHLRFLKKQVDKAKEVLLLKDKLKDISSEYFSKQEFKLKKEFEQLDLEKKEPGEKILKLEKDIEKNKEELVKIHGGSAEAGKIRVAVNELEREIGRYEGKLSQAKEVFAEETEEKDLLFDSAELKEFVSFLSGEVEAALIEEDLAKIKKILEEIKKRIIVFYKKDKRVGQAGNLHGEKISSDEMKDKYQELLRALALAQDKEKEFLRRSEQAVEKERFLYQLEIELSEAKNKMQFLAGRGGEIRMRREEMKKDLEEIAAILGEPVKINQVAGFVDFSFEKGWREIERIKIKLEEGGLVGEEMVREYDEVQQRDEFLTSEIEDLEKSAVSLRELIKQLEEKLDSDFKEGVAKINFEFQKFFETMFGGGSAELKIKNLKLKIKEEGGEEEASVENEEGIEINVSLPRKKIHSLDMLSGGERALTSIALLFAVSQVNPPPFLILDETDAALDESNSRKYAKMLKDLSRQTQLILITHNRETMVAAGVLYGVTMGSDGVSRMLSVKLEEAEDLVS